MPDAVVATWTVAPDPQRGQHVDTRPVTDIAATLASSLIGPSLTILDAPFEVNVYLGRWPAQLAWLTANPDVERVWFVDIGDVTMLRSPWEHMRPGRLYMCAEPGPLRGNRWMLRHHPAPFLQQHIRTADGPILNPGVVGGDRATMIEFHAAMTTLIREHGPGLGYDVAPANWVARAMFADRVEYGPHVSSVFKAYRDNGEAWWQHK